MNASASPAFTMMWSNRPRDDRELMDALPDVAQVYKDQYGVKEFIKGLKGGTDLKMEEVFVAHLHCLRIDQWISGTRLEDGSTRVCFCQSGLPPRSGPEA